MTTNTKVAVGMLVVSNLMYRVALKRSLRLTSKVMKESEKKTDMIRYMATMIDYSNAPMTEFDKIAIVDIWNS